ncbi:MAG TPA: right-handed parallel beta-helix repeat-containing protein [candidate division Zixibacteria bacterium]|nr:hypothetical protein [candidate division Zixibacteria bacterium]MDD4916464.1 right-handed parallel beta-helix repeat-containing protein [candidate division Zixibacteria bacterium]MDM7971861.1 right-handed parallel beta-helix repeat-containing protein [candidate division Zixibacteria bacterium]HOD65111.1 right-handed parallel beta-helix repeat-containing protein [candidate division Zixibacteria bacterium]HOZ06802.1 right-handed parallel beta-helix repeat-containing protein [candidate division
MVRVSIVIVILLAAVPAAGAATRHVPEDYPTIQAAIDSAAGGDTVLVAKGNYSGPGNLDLATRGKNLVIRSDTGPDSTRIIFRLTVGEQWFTRCFLFDSASGGTVLEGFTFVDSGSYTATEGRGLLIQGSSPLIRRCVVSGFHAGSPVVCEGGSPTFDHCTFTGNTGGCSTCKSGDDRAAPWLGRASAVRCTNGATARFDNCDFVGNTADLSQGALVCDASSPLLTDCRFVDNGGYASHAAAVTAGNGSGPVFAKCLFERNRNDGLNREVFGGAVYLYGSTGSFDGCLFDSNATLGGNRRFGTGVCADSGSAATLAGCTFTRNEGGGNSGFSAVWCGPDATVAISRGLAVFNRDCPPVGRADSTGTVTLSCSDLYGNSGGDWTGDIAPQFGLDGNFSLNPHLCDTANPAVGLFDISPCAPPHSPCGEVIGAFGVGCLDARPMILSPAAVLAMEDQPFGYEPEFADPDGPDTVISFGAAPGWCSVFQNTLVGTPPEGASDTLFVLVVSDGYKADTRTVVIDVIPVNDPPALDTIGDQAVDEGEQLEFRVYAADDDSDKLILAAEGIPEGAVFVDSGNGAGGFSWRPGYRQAGAYEVWIAATDDSLAADSVRVGLTVRDINVAPVLDPVDSQWVIEGRTLAIPVSAGDADGDVPVLAAEGLPAHAVFVDSGNGRGRLSFTPDSTQNGVYDVLIVAADTALADSLTVTLIAVDSVPVIAALVFAAETDMQHVVGNAPTVAWHYTDSLQARMQTRFEIAVGLDSDWTTAELWADTVFDSPSTTVAYAGAPLADGLSGRVRLRAANGAAWSEWFEASFRLNSRPGELAALAPSEGSSTGARPMLRVTNAADAEGDSLAYSFVVFLDTVPRTEDSQYVAGLPEGIDSTGWQPPLSLTENRRYRWRAQAFDGYEYSDWTDSTGSLFWVNDAPEPPPMPHTTPITSGCSLLDLLPTFTWSRSLDPDPLDTIVYFLHLATDSGFVALQVFGPLADTAWTPADSLAPGTAYWWKVATEDNTGQRTESAVTSFWTWLPGDANDNHDVAVSDLTLMISHLFRGGSLPCEFRTGDVTGDCAVTVADLTHMISYLFRGGPAPLLWCAE